MCFGSFLLQRKSYLVSFERLYHLYPFIYPKYKHNKSIKAEQIPYFSFFIENEVSGPISSSQVSKVSFEKWTFESKTDNFGWKWFNFSSKRGNFTSKRFDFRIKWDNSSPKMIELRSEFIFFGRK